MLQSCVRSLLHHLTYTSVAPAMAPSRVVRDPTPRLASPRVEAFNSCNPVGFRGRLSKLLVCSSPQSAAVYCVERS
jgi:hypothetical protein